MTRTAVMTSTELIGEVAALYLHDKTSGEAAEGTARFIVDCLSPEHTAAIAHSILEDPTLRERFDLRLPRHFLAEHGLPDDVLTEERATYYRHAECPKPALLLANTGDDEQQSLTELVPVGAPQLLDHPELWVQVASDGLALVDEHLLWWEKALRGLQEQHFVSLERFAEYVLLTRTLAEDEGLQIVKALGAALPALHLPCDSNLFEGVKVRTHASKWKALYGSAQAKRSPYLHKQNPSGVMLSEDDLRTAFARVRESIPEELHPTVEAFIEAPSGWNPAAAALAWEEWELVKPLFDGMQREKVSLGRATKAFFDEREPEILSEAEWEYLERLVERKTTQAEEEDKQFYEAHRQELREDRKLKSAWDKFVYGTPRETTDFLSGLITCLESLFSQQYPSVKRQLVIRCDSRSKKDFRDLNVDAGLYFERRYKGLRSLFGSKVTWELGELFRFSELVEGWKTGNDKDLNYSEAKAALQLKFVVELRVELLNGSQETYSAQMVWRYQPLSVASALVDDWERLAAHPLVRCTAHRDPVTSKDGQSVDLANVRTMMPVYARDRGSFVPVYKQANDLGKLWTANLEDARSAGLISASLADSLQVRFERFQTEYGGAIRGWVEEGFGCAAIERQAEAYAELLDALCRDARGDRNRDLLLRPLMHVGTVAIEGGRPAAVVAPWHPLRFAAMARKAGVVARLVKHLLTAQEIHFGDPRLFFNDYRELLQHPFYPELVLGWRGNKPELLSLADSVADYSLHESPLALAEADATNENPAAGAAQVMELVQRYLALHPHEQANLAVVLYNSDSSRLPTAVVDKVGALHADEEDVRCQIVLRHRDKSRLRGLYEEIVETSDGDADAFNASEGTRDFMARLRISIMADQAPPPDPKDGCPADIVFSQDVIARHARLEWFPQDARPAEATTLVPSRWSRRRPAARDDMKSVVYLSCPVQARDGWAYLTALTTFLKGDWDGRETPRLLPARQLDFQDPDTSQIFTETHNLANWVVNYDELLDRRQLMNQNVRVIRYKQFATQGRNLIVSSKAPLGLLRSMVLRRLGDLNLDLDATECARLAERFIDDANDVSGDIVLRAAKRGRNASELMGIVLSRYLVRSELGAGRHFGWYFLDDYASWLGQREEQIADVMALSPEEVDGRLRLTTLVVESKYIDAASLAAKRRESQNQLRHTVRRIREAVFGAPHRLDRELWLARLSDLLLDGVQFPASANLDLDSWRRGIREGNCELHVRGYSHVFVPTSADADDCSDFAEVSDLEDSYQEVFGRPRVRDLVLRYHHGADPMPVRSAGADPRVWANRTYVRSSDHTALQVSVVSASDAPMELTAGPEPEAHAPVVQVKSFVFPAPAAAAAPARTEPEVTAGWAYPGLAELVGQSGTAAASPEDEMWLRQAEVRARSALQQFQLQSKLVSSVLTPNAALLKFAGSSNLTVDQVMRRRSEFLTTHGLNIISVQPEPGVVAIALERPRRQVIHLQDLWGRWKPTATAGNLDLLIGVREDDGELLMLSPGKEHAPHTLIAGSTGSGKSVLMQNIILGIAATNTPEQARIILIDPKQGVDYFAFESLPHLDGGIIDDQSAALERINALVLEMDERYRRLRDARTPNLVAYNQRVPADERMAMRWLIHDEFAEWMMVDEYKQEVTAAVARLGVKARAAGIHLVFAAQRPDANVMPMQLRANLGNRLILRVDSEGTSEIALGERGAERLLGRGHLLAKLEGQYGLTYAQVPFAAPDFIAMIVDAMQKRQSEISAS